MDPFIILVGIVLIAICNLVDKIKNKGQEPDVISKDDKIVTSAKLHNDVEKELGKPLPKINDASGCGNSLALRDKSWKSLPDFFIKLIKNDYKH